MGNAPRQAKTQQATPPGFGADGLQAMERAPEFLLSPMPPTRSLTASLIGRLRADIVGGALAPGTRLPTEQRLGAALGVSRTVVREAVAALRAEGLVITRQGAGAFVAEPARSAQFRITDEHLDNLARIIEVMELRIGVEAEAAALAARRRNAADLQRLAAALDEIDALHARGERAMTADLEFHIGIAEATRNGVFREFLQYLGGMMVPRQSVRAVVTTPEALAVHDRQVQREHRAILEAVRVRDATAAAAAMRAHLRGSRDRYRRLKNRIEQPHAV
jgi:DNA-binding FadR family transcriptional regulator